MGIYTESVLEVNKRYQIQDVSKFPKDKKYMINQHCVLKQIIGSTAHVSFTGRMTEVPVRSLISVPEYTAKGVQAKNADGFVVISQNALGIPVGTAYLNPEEISDKYFKLTVAGKLVKIPLDITASLVKNKSLEKPLNVQKVSKATGLSENLVTAVDELFAPHENRKDILGIPESLVRLLPGVNLVELRDAILQEEDVWYDMEGNDHKTIAECDKANTKIRHKRLTDRLIEMTVNRFNTESEKIRNEH